MLHWMNKKSIAQRVAEVREMFPDDVRIQVGLVHWQIRKEYLAKERNRIVPATKCERCGQDGKTYWVNDSVWLCKECFKKEKGR